MKLKIISIMFLSASLTGCFTQAMREEWIAENCNAAAAYNNGLRDGLSPHELPERNYASLCLSEQQDLNSEYLRGFKKGLKSRPKEINVNKNVDVTEMHLGTHHHHRHA